MVNDNAHDARSSLLGWPLVAGLAWLVCALAALDLTQGADGIAAVWPSSGILIAALLIFEPRRRVATAVFVAAASMVSNLWAGSGFFATIGYTVANLVEGYLVFFMMGARTGVGRALSGPLVMARFGLAALVAGSASALMAGLLSGNLSLAFLASWASTVTLGMLIVTPIILFVVADQRHRRELLSLKALWTAAVVAVLTLAAFGQADYPLTFLPVLAMAVATATMGLSGAAGALVLIAVIGSVLTAMGTGPITLFFASTENEVLFFQVYLVGLLVSCMPLAYLLARRERDLASVASSAALLEAAEKAAKVGHFRLDLGKGHMVWSREARNICGFGERDQPSLEDWLALHPEDDRKRVSAFLAQASGQALPFAFESRLKNADGQMVHIDCRGGVETDDAGAPKAIFGTMLDVTERADTLAQLELARARLEREAAEVRILAATDSLTGLPNRRCILANLAAALDAAELDGEPVSVAMIDIDYFKQVNDRFGHAVGDAVIRKVADTLSDESRGEDSVGRLGGEEFLFVFPHRDERAVEERCLAIRRRLAGIAWDHPVDVTLSIGIAQLRSGWDESDLLRAADQALYAAKRNGRNRHAVHAA